MIGTPGGGEIIGEMVHWLELSCWLFEESPIRVFATGSARMSHTITLDFASGRSAILMFTVTGTFRYPKEQFELTDHGALMRSLCYVENQYYGIAGVEQRRYFPLTCDPRVGEVRRAGPRRLRGQARRPRAEAFAAHPEQGYLAIGIDKGHFHLLEAFVRSVLDDTPSPVGRARGDPRHLPGAARHRVPAHRPPGPGER